LELPALVRSGGIPSIDPLEKILLNKNFVAALSLVAVAGVAQAGSIPADIQIVDSSGNAYCDVLNGLTSTGAGAGGVWNNLDCAGGSVVLGGPQGKAKGAGAKGYIMGTMGAVAYNGTEFVFVVNKNPTVGLYDMAGNFLAEANWVAVAAGVKSGTRALLAK
jgi:hypothetical protein